MLFNQKFYRHPELVEKMSRDLRPVYLVVAHGTRGFAADMANVVNNEKCRLHAFRHKLADFN